MIDDSKSMYSKEERAEIYKYVAARFLVGKLAINERGLGTGYTVRVSAYLYNHLAGVIDPQCVGEVADDFPEFEAQHWPVVESLGSMTQWHDKFHYKEDEYIDICIMWLEGALKLCL